MPVARCWSTHPSSCQAEEQALTPSDLVRTCFAAELQVDDYHCGLFWRIWWKRSRIERDLRFRQQMLSCRLAWRARSQIQDLSDPHGKRFLFDPREKTS